LRALGWNALALRWSFFLFFFFFVVSRLCVILFYFSRVVFIGRTKEFAR
jgi:hypothetical protein